MKLEKQKAPHLGRRPEADLVDDLGLSQWLGISTGTLEQWRFQGLGPRFVKLGGAKRGPVRYLTAEVDAWLHGQTRAQTGAEGRSAA
ncbi:hypothetical protein Srot_0885 [Segniliparus rotundus DSM 44985]|uniref:Helix-turn-helix domain-containing protein n=1 Tax=Segniliparus rotundus (strain ATCC BAA-972 / CDC 1076 / CIP 108378 / DSM 44985 / JCM 13578) TaxID=640132 RepID=D6ZE82_SEGRD|nr:hypothetical protein [Segniliparus rotundus]ADG97362.1 hypothetical protein Srot_0885 [Segniliparus rotundus DSM 44985]